MGKIISVTIPLPLVEHLQREADIVGISRSRFISNILLNWQENQKKQEITLEGANSDSPPNDCVNREDDGFCKSFEHICNAPQKAAEPCIEYSKEKK